MVPVKKMQTFRNTILSYMRIRVPVKGLFGPDGTNKYAESVRLFSNTTNIHQDRVMDRVISLVKKYDKIDAAQVTEKADFQKDLSLDSLDRVELVMAFEEEFSIEIPDAEADKLKCCADVAKYVVSSSIEKVPESY